MEKTYGEKLVRSGFNPSDSILVKVLKETAANFIDQVQTIVDSADAGDFNADAEEMSAEELQRLKRWAALAITNMETACMYAVKAATI